jgi:putative DNA methylase
MSERRLIEAAFPLKQASLDSVHEKNVRQGHISTLHIWPARRPLAASRAALIATLLPDPGTPEERRKLIEKIGGKVIQKIEKKKTPTKTVDVLREETIGGVLHWGRESSPDLEWFRQEIRKAYGGRAPRVLDPFAGGGAIPLEAMRLGCEVTAADINPVAWFVLKCTLEYPQRLAGQHRALPRFAVESPEFMEAFLKGTSKPTKKQLQRQLEAVQQSLFPPPDVDLAWHVRAWGFWVLQQARKDLQGFYVTSDDRPTVAYLWARTVYCKNCRATIPLLKTCWLCKKDEKRVLLKLKPSANRTGVEFDLENDVPMVGGNAAQRREHDRRLGQGTMSRNGAWCPCCGQPGTVAMEIKDIAQEGLAGRLGAVMTALVVDGPHGKEYRLPTATERQLAEAAADSVQTAIAALPFGAPDERIPKGGSGASRAFSVDGYGFDRWRTLFTPRQLLALATFAQHTRSARAEMVTQGYPPDWAEAIGAYLACMLDRLANQGSSVAHWNLGGEKIEGTFARFALPIVWDFAEVNPLGNTSGGYPSAFDWVTLATDHLTKAALNKPAPDALCQSALTPLEREVDVIVTDPPYYDAIPYSDLMDFFYVWLRRSLNGMSPELDQSFSNPLAPKWNCETRDGELIDDSSRFGGDKTESKQTYEDGMFRAFEACRKSLAADGRLVIVFAHKHPDAWETLVSAIIRAGFVVDGSWPIQTERVARTRSLSSAALSSSVWLVCRERPEDARPGWDNRVMEDMRTSINVCLREYWDAGIRGPDFVWAATGPALEAYSRHPVVKKANEPGKTMEVSEFLRAVRRIVVDFVVGRVLSPSSEEETVSGLDDLTTYYLLHRNDFGLEDAPIGPCILYAVSCGLSDADLADQLDLLTRTGGSAGSDGDEAPEESEDPEAEVEQGTGSKVRLKTWQQRKAKGMGYDGDGRPAQLIDQVHRLMHLWKAGDQVKVDEYLEARALAGNRLFHRVLQALIELADEGSEERALLESISNHVAGKRPELAAQVPGWDIRRGGQSEEGEGT